MYNCLCKKEMGLDTPKWVFHRGGGIHPLPPPPGHPEISDAESNRVNSSNNPNWFICMKWAYVL
jgi:hypothetical protein